MINLSVVNKEIDYLPIFPPAFNQIDKKIVRTEIGVLLRLSHPNIVSKVTFHSKSSKKKKNNNNLSESSTLTAVVHLYRLAGFLVKTLASPHVFISNSLCKTIELYFKLNY